MATLIILPAARADLMEIADYIAMDSPVRALSFIDEIESTMRATAERPTSFPQRPDLHKGLRAARHGRYMIFFLEVGDEVRIIRVLHTARDHPQLLDL